MNKYTIIFISTLFFAQLWADKAEDSSRSSTTIDILYETVDPVGGFQFQLEEVTIISASGGAAAAARVGAATRIGVGAECGADEADGQRAVMEAEALGLLAQLTKRAEGIGEMVGRAGGTPELASLLMITGSIVNQLLLNLEIGKILKCQS